MWYKVPSSVHGVGQFSSNDVIWRVGDEAANVSNPSWYYEFRVIKITGIAKPVLARKDTRSVEGFIISSAEFWNNFAFEGQLDGFALFASTAEVGSHQYSDATTGLVNLWMDANGKVVATAPTGGGTGTGNLTIPIPTGGNLVITVQPQYGTVALVTGNIQYTATNGYSGSDAFTYEIRGASGEVISSGTCSFSTSAATATAIPSFPKSVIDVAGDIRVNCVAGASVTLYKNGDSIMINTIGDTANLGYVLFSNVVRVQTDTFKAKAQKAGLSISGFSIITTTKRKPVAISGVTKQVAAGGSVTITIAELVTDSENATFF